MTDSRKVEHLNSAVFYIAVALLSWLVFRIVSPFLQPLGWAGILAILIHPVRQRLAARWGASRAALAGTLAVMFILIGPGAMLAVYFVREGLQAAQGLQDLAGDGRLQWLARLWASIAQRLGSNVDLSTMLQDAAKNIATFLAGSLGGLLANFVRLILDLLLMLFALFFFLRDGHYIIARARQLLPFEEHLRERMFADAAQLIDATIRVSLIIAILQGSICGLAFALAGIGAPIFWALIMSFMALLPVIGSWPVWVPAAIWLFATGNIVRGVIILVLCGGIAGTLDNILRPMLMTGRSTLGGLSVFISVLGGVAAFGMIGLVLGPIVFAMMKALLDVYLRPVDPMPAASP